MAFRSPALLALARLAPHCMCECGRPNDGTMQAAHRNETKAMGDKTPDFAFAALLGECHMRLDQGRDMNREDRRSFWNRAYWRTQAWLWSEGLITIAAEPVEHVNPPKRPSKKIRSAGKIASRPMQSSGQPIPSRPMQSRGFEKRKAP